MVWNCDWARPSATVPTGSVSDRARAFRPRTAQTATAAVHHRAVDFRPPLVTVSPCMRRTAHVRCTVGLIPSRHGFIKAKDPFSSSSLTSAHSSARAPPVIMRCAAAKSTDAPLRSVTPHPKPATALPTDPSTGTIDLSSGRSPMAPLCPSCRKRLHVHRCLQSSSSPATTP
jgi:hypothetical protein